MPSKYLGNTAYRTKQEADASIANLVMRMWRSPGASRDDIVDHIVTHINSYGIKDVDTIVLRKILHTYVSIIDQLLAMDNVELICPEAAFTIKWIKENGYAR